MAVIMTVQTLKALLTHDPDLSEQKKGVLISTPFSPLTFTSSTTLRI